jgi:hypothetical protein
MRASSTRNKFDDGFEILGVLDNLLATGSPVNQHATDGWPTFSYWPNPRSQTHHQTYYVWMKRAWMGGQRIMVNHFVANEVICQVWPLKEHDCDEMESVKLQRQLLLDLEEYVDAQEGGPGKGWFRIVYDSATAREVIADGKLAVVMGIENEKLFNCGEFMGMPECTEQQILEYFLFIYSTTRLEALKLVASPRMLR